MAMTGVLPRIAAEQPDSPGSAWILRLGVVMCFVGHGMLGVARIATPWTAYFGVVGIGPDTALQLMPWVGAFDILMAMVVLARPNRALLLYMSAWCFWTALLRPLAGESAWETVERAGNYGATLALFVLLAPAGSLPNRLGEPFRARVLHWTLRVTTALLLLGHGMLNWIVMKPLFLKQYGVLGLPGMATERAVGVFECLLALAVFIKPDYRLLAGVVVWKLATELLSPMAGSSFWVFVEHGGSYAAPLALAFLLWRSSAKPAIAPVPV